MTKSWTTPVDSDKWAIGTYLVIMAAILAMTTMAWLIVAAYLGDERQKAWMVKNHCVIDHYVATAFDVVPIFRCDAGLFKYHDMPR
jgi:hypothetical protein